ncbi:MAG: PQQ-binding-like beta-propeller repeat protein [Rhodopirellula sp.]|nr:PQQ-binding-like beta-propeller repeat protein [Rhodopirellula sp.]
MKMHPQFPFFLFSVVVCCRLLSGNLLMAGDWPTYRADAARSGYTGESLPRKLAPRWIYQARHAPRPAWSGRDTRMPFDRALLPVVSGESVYFGSSADGKVYALDASTGAMRWEFFTGGPVRFPPAVNADRVFVASDDGFLYCLAAADGRVLWKLRGGSSDSRVLGNDRMISRWPARGGPAIADGVVYFAAGIWPSEGIFVYAVDVTDGRVIWCNDDSGAMEMPQPHGGAVAKSGISGQGNLVVAGRLLLVPTGRGVPAALDRRTGQLLYFHLQQYRALGGSEIAAAGSHFLHSGAIFDVATGHAADGSLATMAAAVAPDRIVCAVKDELVALDRRSMWTRRQGTDRKGQPVEKTVLDAPVWRMKSPLDRTLELSVAGRQIIACGEDRICVIDQDTQATVFASPTDGAPFAPVVAGGRLFVATDRGFLYCFDGGKSREPKRIGPVSNPTPVKRDPLYHRAASEIIEQTGVTAGYCLDLGCGDGSLAEELAEQTDLQILAIDPDAANVAAARRRLDAAGLYGVRVTVDQGDPAATDYPDYFANLVVSGRSVTAALPAGAEAELNRIVRPYGGQACLGRPGEMTKTVRGELAGAGTWTHQYCNPANTNCSADLLARGPLAMLWFTDWGFPMPSRHGRGPAPLVLDGRLFVEGLDGLLAVDAYNGRRLWEYPLPGILHAYDGEHLMGTAGTGSNLCLSRDGLFVRTGGKCLRIDPISGKLLAEYQPPRQEDGREGTWGLVAVVGQTLFGTLSDTEHVVGWRYQKGDMSTQFTESIQLFAIDVASKKLKWTYQPEHSIRNNSVAIAASRVYLIDRPTAAADLLSAKTDSRRGQPLPPHPPGTLVALDAETGQPAWTTPDAYGTTLAVSEEHDILVMSYQDTRFKLDSEIGGRMAALRASSGAILWDVAAKYASRLLINGSTIYAQPGAWDLLSGEPQEFDFQRSYGCGTLAGSRHLLVYRSATLGYTDLSDNRGTENYGGIRPGCWINALPAAGLVLVPDATDRCTCSYLIKASVALQTQTSTPQSLRGSR